MIEWPTLPHIGKPITNVRIELRTDDGAVSNDGNIGEIWAFGDAVGLGYLGRPEETAARFVTSRDGIRGYRTGDLARRNADGNIEFVGRMDRQVKIRGHRVELGEVEAHLLAHPAIGCCVVEVVEDPAGQRSLVAYIVPNKDMGAEEGEIRMTSCRRDPRWYPYLVERLPSYEVPESYVCMADLPRTQTGKVDVQQLKFPLFVRPELRNPLVLPETNTEKVLSKVWRDALQIVEVGIDDHFFELGGHSLLLAFVSAELKARGFDVSITRLLEYSTIRRIAAYIDAGRDNSSSSVDHTPSTDMPVASMSQDDSLRNHRATRRAVRIAARIAARKK